MDSDEKFHWDGRNGMQCCQHEGFFPNIWWSVRVRGTFSVKGKTELVRVKNRQNELHYIENKHHYERNFVFQQNNSTIHSAKGTKKWFDAMS